MSGRSAGYQLAEVRSTLAAALESAHRPIHDAHLARLKDLAARHPDWRQLIETEIASIEKRRAATANGSTVPNLPRPLASLGGISGFQEFEDVVFVHHPENTGGRFRVRHQDREFFIHLLWLSCAPPEPAAKPEGDHNAFARHFGLAPEDAS